MHSATLYKHDEQGHKCRDTPIARIVVTDDAEIEIRMVSDDSLLYSGSLETLGYQLLWSAYPVTVPRLLS